MRVLNIAIFICALVCITIPVSAVEITPSNLVYPTSSGEVFSFDYIVSDAMGVSANTFKSTISVSGPGVLTFDNIASKAVVANTDYWVYDNSVGVYAEDIGNNNYTFSDNPDFPSYEALINGDIMARYAFTWDGTVGDYTFTLDFSMLKSYVITYPTFTKEPLQFTPGNWPGNDSSFTVTIPEPATLILLALGSTILLRKRSQ